MPEHGSPAASVVIPAHNEASGILDCLRPLVALGPSLPLEIVVAANGCDDDTVALARTQPGVRVLDLPEPSKVAALNAADEVATVFPRIYLDADVQLDEPALRGIVSALTTDEPRLAAPSVHYDTRGADPVVARYYRVFVELPSARSSTVGRGVYAVSEAGRARFTRFPDLQGDDLFVNRLFSPEERVVTPGFSTVRTPRLWRDLLRVRTRLAAGNAELARAREGEVGALSQTHDFSRTAGATLRALATLVARRPRLLPAAAVYIGVNTLARTSRGRGTGWHRDESSR